MCYLNDDFEAAKDFYERGAKFKPRLASHLLASLARSQGDYHRYQSLLEQALQSRQFENQTRDSLDDDYSFVRLCNFYIDCSQVVDEQRQRKFMDKCLELLQRVFSHFPYNAFAANAFGIYLALREMYTDAREVFHSLVGTPAAEMAKLNLAHIQVLFFSCFDTTSISHMRAKFRSNWQGICCGFLQTNKHGETQQPIQLYHLQSSYTRIVCRKQEARKLVAK